MNLLNLNKFLSAKAEELEGYSWYEITSRLGLFSFNSMGNRPVELIVESSGISGTGKILMAGCGSGGTSVHIAEITGAEVFGIDITEESVNMARQLALASKAKDRLHFQTDDAHSLSFEDNTFDLVITEFMAFFLRQEAFNEFFRVLKPGGRIAMAELMKSPDVDRSSDIKILNAEKTYTGLLGYKFHIPTVADYIEILKKARYSNISIQVKFRRPGFHEALEAVGGWANLLKIIAAVMRLMIKSPVLRKKFMQMGKVKKILYRNKSTAKYISQVIMTGIKNS